MFIDLSVFLPFVFHKSNLELHIEPPINTMLTSERESPLKDAGKVLDSVNLRLTPTEREGELTLWWSGVCGLHW